MTRVSAVFILITISLSIACVLSQNDELYSNKYDYINIEEILANERVRNQYYRCFLGSAPCLTPDAKFLKEKFPEAIVTKCRKCTDKQKVGFEKIVLYYTEKDPEAWNLILKKAVNDIKISL